MRPSPPLPSHLVLDANIAYEVRDSACEGRIVGLTATPPDRSYLGAYVAGLILLIRSHPRMVSTLVTPGALDVVERRIFTIIVKRWDASINSGPGYSPRSRLFCRHGKILLLGTRPTMPGMILLPWTCPISTRTYSTLSFIRLFVVRKNPLTGHQSLAAYATS